MTPEERSLRSRIAAHARWAKADPEVSTRKARDAFLARFERQADPDGVLDPRERARRADHLLKAHMLRMALASSQARRKRKKP